ncbi:MAG: ribbon-helix-helix protein, CopG family [Actinobacteria bacterium]|jgi:CopG family transcriptional regulator/antitoxin EndoAI|nr:MAG: ribbon-helix-helix protein, CopG family [Actinomycetota bacterium]
MRESVTISLPANLKKKLDQATKRGHVNRSDIVRDALRQYFALQDFRVIREKAVAEAEARGIFTDEDVFKEIS